MRKIIVLFIALLVFVGLGTLGAFMTGDHWGTKEFGGTVYEVVFALVIASIFAFVILDIDLDNI
jgi:CO dehydrogenase/acetyl-CoA synthase delta subunit